ncbi:MAG: arylesterase [Rhodanobacteraceae bacterium]
MRSWLPSCMLSCLVLLVAAQSAVAAPPKTASGKTILLLGDSLSAAHNIELDRGWPSLLQARLLEMRPPRTLINASISGETTSSGSSRLPGLLKTYRPALVILELGANDGLRGLPLAQIRANLQSMIRECRADGAKVLLLGIELPVNYGPQYRDGLRTIYAQLAKENQAALVPFLLQGIALDPKAMQDDGLHPTAAAQPRVLENVWPALAPMLGASLKTTPRSVGG